MRTRKFWGWGYEDELLTDEEENNIDRRIASTFNLDSVHRIKVPNLEGIDLPEPRIKTLKSLESLFSDDKLERLNHSYGKSFPDSARSILGIFTSPPDLVAFPNAEEDISSILDWASSNDVAVIPYGGGSSVCGGVETAVSEDYKGVISLDMKNLNSIVEIDKESRSALIQGGIFGPDLESQLKEHDLTMRHYPQSFEFSTLGGWIATRSGGHYATLYTHIDDFVESLKMITPSGSYETRRLPGSGAGPSPDRFAIGSEGIMGIITEASMRLQDRPIYRSSCTVEFEGYKDALNALRQISQAALFPSNCRLLDSNEALFNGAGDGSKHLLILAFESADHDKTHSLNRALEICRENKGIFEVSKESSDSHRSGSSGNWRNSFIKAPYLRESFTRRGIIQDTFETAITWDRSFNFINDIKEQTANAILKITGKPSLVTCRITHSYPDGLAPYFTFGAFATPETMLEVWKEIKLATNEICISNQGTVTHHHAVGRDHRPKGYDSQRPDLFHNVLVAAKASLDPKGIMNPGVLIDPENKSIKNWIG
ncbi:MAG: FAD-binding oxidoreductase [Gammaproteobacteria bacterium]|nr:MAG: FAD-binding oxidoreductase [Gammaproteobacteria bacterium]